MFINALLRLFPDQRASNIRVNSPLLETRPDIFAKKLADDEFISLIGWLERFQLRFKTNIGKISSEAADVNHRMVI